MPIRLARAQSRLRSKSAARAAWSVGRRSVDRRGRRFIGFAARRPRAVADTVHPRSWYEDSGSSSESPPLGDPPSVPGQEPETRQALNDFAKQAAWWAAKALARELANPAVGTLLDAIDLVYWGYKAAPYVRAYLDPSKPLDELKQAVSNSAAGYDIHHVVEKKAAKDAKYPDQMIDGPDNLVRIPTLKHWQITGWYMRSNSKFQNLSSREYLRDKGWGERTRVGREALIEFKVLKP
jgi:hypothetical protein